jgi:threonine/homoserine/homoserine lactone efflux protein
MTLDLLVIALGVALEPIPLTGFVVVMSAEGGRRKGVAYLLGWMLSLVVVVAVTLLVTGNEPPAPATAPSTFLVVVKVVVGLGLMGVGVRRYRRRSLPKPQKQPPKWQRSVDRMSPWTALALGVALQPWGLIAAGVATVAEAKISSAEDVVSLVLFCLIGSAPYLTAVALSVVDPVGTIERLARLRAWLDVNTDRVVTWVAIVIGAYLVVKGCVTLA